MSRAGGAAWARLSSTIYMNRKIRRAGRLGREVYIFVLTMNASRGGTGSIPSADLEPWYVADMLMMDEVEATEGITRAIAANLLRTVGDVIEIVGWDNEWAWMPMTEAERKRRQRAKATCDTNEPDVEANGSPDDVQTRPDVVTADAGPSRMSRERKDKTKGEKKTADGAGAPELHQQAEELAVTAIAEINRLAGSAYKSDSKETIKLCRGLAASKRTPDEAKLVVAAKWKEWNADPKMRKFFRPATLLAANKFNTYLEDAIATRWDVRPVLAQQSDVAQVVIDGEVFDVPATGATP